VPLEDDYDCVDEIVGSVWSLLNTEGASIDPDTVQDLMATLTNSFVHDIRTQVALKNVADMKGLQHVVARNGTAKATVERRSQEWFDENGYCLDHIYVKNSTIRQAGKGAFSRRHLPNGSVINSSPLIAAPRAFMETNYTEIPINSKQIMFNYHFGHRDSSILFYPLTQINAINHNSNRTEEGMEPNARLQFSKQDRKTQYLLQRPLEDIYAEKYSSLIVDVIATKDIQPDDEIFIDYGEEWEKAWNSHVQNWKTPCKDVPISDCLESSQMVAITMNEDRHNPKYHQWSDVHLSACKANDTVPWITGTLVFLTDFSDALHDDPSIKQEYLGFKADDDGFNYSYLSHLNPRPCKILKTDKEKDTAEVVYFLQPHQIPEKYRNQKVPDARAVVHYEGLASKDYRFINKPLKADWHDPNAFRHEIHIPDEHFPLLWRDLASL
jgi:hypothetical protein